MSRFVAVLIFCAFASALPAQTKAPAPRYRSTIQILDLESKSVRPVHVESGVAEAPNWSRDGKFLLFNFAGDLFRLPLDPSPGKPERLQLAPGGPYRCNNDHDLSRDGKLLAFSASTQEHRQSQIYVAKADGTEVRQLTFGPGASYFHGWSPDSKWLAFVGQRNGKFELFRVPATGGPEERLTSAGAYDDGPEYSPDGKWIYFNSDRGGGWNVWRMPANGAGEGDREAEQVTRDEWEDWFPHFSPDGRTVVFLSFPPGTRGHNDRMPGVVLRVLRQGAKSPEIVHRFFGGQGSINVNSWAPDSKRFAFVEYQPLE